MQKPSFEELNDMVNDLINAYRTVDPVSGDHRAIGAIKQLLIMLLDTPTESSAELTIDYIQSRAAQLMTADV